MCGRFDSPAPRAYSPVLAAPGRACSVRLALPSEHCLPEPSKPRRLGKARIEHDGMACLCSFVSLVHGSTLEGGLLGRDFSLPVCLPVALGRVQENPSLQQLPRLQLSLAPLQRL